MISIPRVPGWDASLMRGRGRDGGRPRSALEVVGYSDSRCVLPESAGRGGVSGWRLVGWWLVWGCGGTSLFLRGGAPLLLVMLLLLLSLFLLSFLLVVVSLLRKSNTWTVTLGGGVGGSWWSSGCGASYQGWGWMYSSRWV